MAGLKFNPHVGQTPPKPPVGSPQQAAHLNPQNLSQAGLKNQIQAGQTGKTSSRNTPNEPGALPSRKSDGRGKGKLSGELAQTLQNLTISRRGGKGGKGADTGGGGLHGGSSQSVSRTRTGGTEGRGPVKYRAVSTPSTLAQRRTQHTDHPVAMPPAQAGAAKGTAKAKTPGATDLAETWMPPSAAMAPKSRHSGPFGFLKGGFGLRSTLVHRFTGRAMGACQDFFARMLSPTPEQKQIQRNQDRKIELRKQTEATAVREQGLEKSAEKQGMEKRYRETVGTEERDTHPQFAQHPHTTPGHSFRPGTMPHQAIVQPKPV